MKAKTFFNGATLATAAPAHPGELTKEQQTEAIVNAYNEHLENHSHSENEKEEPIKENQVSIYGIVSGIAMITLTNGKRVNFPFDGFNQA